MQLEDIKDENGNSIAIIISEVSNLQPGHTFPTQPSDELQVGLFNHKQGHEISRHYHPPFARELNFTTEVLLILSGSVQVDIYNDSLKLVKSVQVGGNSVIILKRGGHGFSILQDAIIVEVKQGPYAGDKDKIVF